MCGSPPDHCDLRKVKCFFLSTIGYNIYTAESLIPRSSPAFIPRPGNGATAFAVYSTKRLNENLREIHAEVRENVARS